MITQITSTDTVSHAPKIRAYFVDSSEWGGPVVYAGTTLADVLRTMAEVFQLDLMPAGESLTVEVREYTQEQIDLLRDL